MKEKVTLVLVTVAVIAGFGVALNISATITPTGQEYGWNLLSIALGLWDGSLSWPTSMPYVAGGLGLAILSAVVGGIFLWGKLRRRVRNRKKHSEHLAAKDELRPLRSRGRRKEAKQLHPDADRLGGGQPLGRTVGQGHHWLYQGWRDLAVFVFGTGRGKTTGVVVRRMVEAPGAAVMTSNKVDGIKQVVAGRTGRGEIYVFDPNQIYRHDHELPDFIFNPLSTIETFSDAKELAAIFESSTRKQTDRGGDAHFDGTGRDLVAAAMFAAKLEDRPLTTVYEWLARHDGAEIRDTLRRHGHRGPAMSIEGLLSQPERTKGGTYATAFRMVSALADDDLVAWTSAANVRTFNPDEFLGSSDTLILLSKDGEGSGSALLTALVRAICKSAERAAQRNNGRLRVPLVMELDECANTVHWPELPSVYSFYGSMGIILDSYFQSRAQGRAAFGNEGWQTLWDAASTRVFGGGSGDDEFLRSLANLVGEHDETVHSTSTSAEGHSSTSTSTRKVSTLDVAALSSLPAWRAVVISSHAPPVLAEIVPWFRDSSLRAIIEAPEQTETAEVEA